MLVIVKAYKPGNVDLTDLSGNREPHFRPLLKLRWPFCLKFAPTTVPPLAANSTRLAIESFQEFFVP